MPLVVVMVGPRTHGPTTLGGAIEAAMQRDLDHLLDAPAWVDFARQRHIGQHIRVDTAAAASEDHLTTRHAVNFAFRLRSEPPKNGNISV
jgi:hypothetical protein